MIILPPTITGSLYILFILSLCEA